MNINRHNYEEFFLLYVDDELQADQRMLVEKFIAENPDLSGELKMLQQVTLKDEAILFNGKEELYKKENGIALTNYEEYFLLSVDDELSQKEKDEVEKFVLQHPDLQNDFTLLQQTKLIPEPVLFKDKKDLYRYEKTRRIIPIAWARLSVAAAILGLIATVWIFNTPDEQSPAVVTVPKPIKAEPGKGSKPLTEQPVTEQPVATLPEKEVSNKHLTVEETALNKKSVAEKIQPVTEAKVERNVARNNEPSFKKNKASVTTNNLVVKEEENLISEEKNEEAFPVASNKKNNNSLAKPVEETDVKTRFANNPDLRDEPVLATNTLYREIEADEEEKSIYVGATRINKNKLKGLFKKASGFLDKKLGTNLTDNRDLR